MNLVNPRICCSFGPASRYLGLVSFALEDWDAAEDCFEEAVQICDALLATAESLLVRTDYARMLAARGRRGDRRVALEQLAAARADAERLRVPRVTRNLDALRGQLCG